MAGSLSGGNQQKVVVAREFSRAGQAGRRRPADPRPGRRLDRVHPPPDRRAARRRRRDPHRQHGARRGARRRATASRSCSRGGSSASSTGADATSRTLGLLMGGACEGGRVTQHQPALAPHRRPDPGGPDRVPGRVPCSSSSPTSRTSRSSGPTRSGRVIGAHRRRRSPAMAPCSSGAFGDPGRIVAAIETGNANGHRAADPAAHRDARRGDPAHLHRPRRRDLLPRRHVQHRRRRPVHHGRAGRDGRRRSPCGTCPPRSS